MPKARNSKVDEALALYRQAIDILKQKAEGDANTSPGKE